jgi:hypothetical protein
MKRTSGAHDDAMAELCQLMNEVGQQQNFGHDLVPSTTSTTTAADTALSVHFQMTPIVASTSISSCQCTSCSSRDSRTMNTTAAPFTTTSTSTTNTTFTPDSSSVSPSSSIGIPVQHESDSLLPCSLSQRGSNRRRRSSPLAGKSKTRPETRGDNDDINDNDNNSSRDFDHYHQEQGDCFFNNAASDFNDGYIPTFNLDNVELERDAFSHPSHHVSASPSSTSTANTTSTTAVGPSDNGYYNMKKETQQQQPVSSFFRSMMILAFFLALDTFVVGAMNVTTATMESSSFSNT